MPRGYYERKPPRPLAELFWRHVMPEPNSGCWLWTGSINDSGYAVTNTRPPGAEKCRPIRMHRVGYELLRGPIPAGTELDHKCRVRCCVNPDHLEPVTHAENLRRGTVYAVLRALHAAQTHCRQGHPLSGGNLYIRPTDGRRACNTCKRAATRKWRANQGNAATKAAAAEICV